MAILAEEFKDRVRRLLRLSPPPVEIPASVTKQLADPTKELEFLKKTVASGMFYDKSALTQMMTELLTVSIWRRQIYRDCELATTHPLIAGACDLYVDYCLSGETVIPLLDGRKLKLNDIIAEVNQGKQLWVYSANRLGKPEAAKILAGKKTGNKLLKRIWLDNGAYVDATDEHKFIKRTGENVFVRDLAVGDSLLPFHRKLSKKNYEMVYDIEKGNWESTYKMVFRSVYGVDTQKVNKGKTWDDHNFLDIHHKDFCKENNSPENLQLLKHSVHLKIHTDLIEAEWKDPIKKQKRLKNFLNPYKNSGIGWKKCPSKKGRTFVEMYGKEKADILGNQISKRMTKKHEYVDRICACGCGESFSVDLYGKSRNKKFIQSHHLKVPNYVPRGTQWQNEEFRQNFVPWNKKPSYNHKVVKIEEIGNADVFDIEVGGSHLFAVDAGIYIHNSVGYNALQGSSTWITSDDPKKENVLNKFLQDINIEERIRDWASQIVIYGDFFVQPIGKEGLGIAYIDDNIHPADMERIDVNGRLEGFVRTGLYGDGLYTSARPVESPWSFVHFKTYGSSRKMLNTALGVFGDPTRRFSLEQRMLDANRKFRITTKYGISLLNPALQVYKRLKMAEDSLMMARITRGVLWYLYKLKVGKEGETVNFDAALALVNEYAELLKRKGGLNTTPGAEQFKDKWTGMAAQIEDLFVPETPNLELNVEKLGGEPNIRWIADIDMLENQLLGALRVSKTLLGICLRGDVKIRLLDGSSVTIKEMSDNAEKYVGQYIYACSSKGDIIPKKIKGVGMTRPNANFVRVHIDNGQHFDVTPDHPCMLRDGSFIAAEKLVPDASLMPLYTKHNGKLKSYEQYYDPKTNSWKFTHRTVLKEFQGLKKIKKGLIIHHKDFNPKNNDPSNLILMKNSDHLLLHSNSNWADPDYKKKISKKISITRTGKSLVNMGHGKKCTCSFCSSSSLVITRTCPNCGEILESISVNKYRNHRSNCKSESKHIRNEKVKEWWNTPKGLEERKRRSERAIQQNKQFGKLNHKVLFVERLDVIEDAYDIQIEDGYSSSGEREHCFALDCGVFVHNTDDLPGSLGESSASRISINFAKNAQRIQNAVRQGIKRLCQIHLAYLKMNADPTSFDVQLAEVSSAEEEELKNAMASGIDVVDRFSDFLIKMCGTQNIDSLELLDYLNQKFLKLDDLELQNFVIRDINKDVLPGDQPAGNEGGQDRGQEGEQKEPQPIERVRLDVDKIREAFRKRVGNIRENRKRIIASSDLMSYLPNQQLYSLHEKNSRGLEVKQLSRTWIPFNVKFSKDENMK